MDGNYCDLCEKENCNGPMTMAHKPFMFRFYHSKHLKNALEEFQSNRDNENNSDVVENSSDEGEYDIDEVHGNETDDEEFIVLNGEYNKSENEEREEGEEEEGRKGKLEVLEEEEVIENDDHDKCNVEEEVKEEIEEELEEEEEEEYDEEEEEEEDEEDEVEEEEEEERFIGNEDSEGESVEEGSIIENDKIVNLIIPTSTIDSLVTEVNGIMCKTIDMTMAAGVGIMAGIVSMTSNNKTSHNLPASFFNMESTAKTFLGTALATIGMIAGVKEIINAVNEKPPQLPICEYCNKSELEQPGCRAFCESCGECDAKSYWKDGTTDAHCLNICKDCNNNCVICEKNVASVKGHHDAFATKVHGKIVTRLDGTYKDARIFGSSLIIGGILTCIVPGISWAWGVGLVAGSVLANSGIRIIANPVVRIRCDACDIEGEADEFKNHEGCQTWCQCCGVQDGNNERYCMAICEDCSQE